MIRRANTPAHIHVKASVLYPLVREMALATGAGFSSRYESGRVTRDHPKAPWRRMAE